VQSLSGGPPHTRTLQALAQLGLDPARDDVAIVATGDEASTAAALVSGVIDGASLSYAAAATLKAQGYGGWDMAALGVAELFGLTARAAQPRERSEEARRLLRAVAASIAYLRSIDVDAAARERVAAVTAGHLRSQPEAVLAQLAEIKDSMPVDLRATLEEARQLHAVMASIEPSLASLNLADALDQSLVDELQQSGFFATLRRS
jgi:ABC-type nitrate/sulfonate/bicarbonate transport system substrate-binding protein